jgi:NADH-quinone oxidoreductase subunit N
MTIADLLTILPVVVVAVWGVGLLVVDLWVPRHRKGITALLAAAGFLVALGLVIAKGLEPSQPAFQGMVMVDGFAVFLDIVFLLSALAGIALAFGYMRKVGIERGEYYPLLMFTTAGMMLMTYAADLIVVFIALELLSIPLYVMAGFVRLNPASEEAALKYFLLGAFSSGFVLYGIALLYGATAHTELSGIVAAVSSGTVNMPLFVIGAALLLVGFGFKSGVVPFHAWSPDVYEGAPSSVTAFMSVGAKAAGFAALLRVFVTAFPGLATDMTPILWVLAALTMVVGNVVAIAQRNIKRMLAYSSIAQTGYLLMAFVPYGNGQVLGDSIAGILFYLAAYGLATFGAWSVVVALEQAEQKGLNLEDYAGLGRRAPLLALVMTVAMLSFTGVPLTLGFWGKFYLFSTVVKSGFTGLALVGLVTSVLSAFYYLRVVVMMYMRSGEPQVKSDAWLNLTAVLSAVLVVGLGFVPGWLLNLAAGALLQIP